jgi:hypothetical protein
MESPKRITKNQLLEMVRQEVDFQERKKLLENRISELNEEIFFLTEGESGKKKKKDDDIDEGLFQNIGRAVSRGISGVGQIGQGIKQNYQKGVDQKGLEHISADIKQKEQELAQLKNDFKFKTGKSYNTKNSQNPTALARDKQGVIKKATTKKAATPPPPPVSQNQGNKKQTAKPAAVQQPVAKKQTAKPAAVQQPVAKKQNVKPAAVKKPVAKKQTANVIPAKKQGKKVAQ